MPMYIPYTYTLYAGGIYAYVIRYIYILLSNVYSNVLSISIFQCIFLNHYALLYPLSNAYLLHISNVISNVYILSVLSSDF